MMSPRYSTTFATSIVRVLGGGVCPNAGLPPKPSHNTVLAMYSSRRIVVPSVGNKAYLASKLLRPRGGQNSQQFGQIVTGVPSYLVKLNPGNTSLNSVAVSRKIEIAIASPSLIPSTPSDR